MSVKEEILAMSEKMKALKERAVQELQDKRLKVVEHLASIDKEIAEYLGDEDTKAPTKPRAKRQAVDLATSQVKLTEFLKSSTASRFSTKELADAAGLKVPTFRKIINILGTLGLKGEGAKATFKWVR